MTPADFIAAREQIGLARGLGRKLTQHEMADALDMGKHGWQSISKWENGHAPIPGPVALAVRCLTNHQG
jgi:hypothetical protein